MSSATKKSQISSIVLSYIKEIKEISSYKFSLLFILSFAPTLVEGFAIWGIVPLSSFDYQKVSPLVISLIYLVAVTLIAYLSYYRTHLQAYLQSSYLEKKREIIFKSNLTLSTESYINSSSGKIINNLSVKLVDSATSIFIFLQVFSSLCFLLIFTVFSFFQSAHLTLISLLVGGLSFLFLKIFYKNSYKHGYNLMEENSLYYSNISSYLKNLIRFKIAGTEKEVSNLHQKQSHKISDLLIKAATEQANLNFYGTLIFSVGLITVALSVLYLKIDLDIKFIACLLFLSRIFTKISSLNPQLQYLSELFPSFEDIYKITRSEKIANLDLIDSSDKTFTEFKSLSIKNPKYQWKDNEKFIFPEVNFKITPGEFLLILGPSGLGKSTFAHILGGLLEAKSGEFILNESTKISSKELRNLVSYMPQENNLLESSVLDNLTLFNENFKESELHSILKLVKLDKRINNLLESPKALGLKLSGGEMQRLILAQTLLLERPILLLDEATNSLNQELEEEIFENIKKKWPKLAIIAISHKSSLEKLADNVLKIN